MNHKEKAKDLFQSGYNCAQSVFAAYAEELGMDFETALKVSSSFGAGMGRFICDWSVWWAKRIEDA